MINYITYFIYYLNLEFINLMSSVSDNRCNFYFNLVYEHLKNELNKRKDLQQIKEILEKNDSTNNSKKINDFNIIYKFKLESIKIL